MELEGLRPVERRILRLVDAGVPHVEIASRFRRSPDHIRRVVELARLPGRDAPGHRADHLRPLERCVLGWRARGATHAEIAPRLRRSPGFVARVEQLAQYKLGSV